jgi:hypothetical protein
MYVAQMLMVTVAKIRSLAVTVTKNDPYELEN